MRLKNHILLQINRYHVIYTVLFIYFVWPSRFAMIYYENIGIDEIYESLVKKSSKNSTLEKIQCVSF